MIISLMIVLAESLCIEAMCHAANGRQLDLIECLFVEPVLALDGQHECREISSGTTVFRVLRYSVA